MRIAVVLIMCSFLGCRKKGHVSGHVVNHHSNAPVEGVMIRLDEYHIQGIGDIGRSKYRFKGETVSNGTGDFSFDVKFARRQKFEYQLMVVQDAYIPVPETDHEVYYSIVKPSGRLILLKEEKEEELEIRLRTMGRLMVVGTDLPPASNPENVRVEARDDVEETWIPVYNYNLSGLSRVPTNGKVYLRISTDQVPYTRFDSINLAPFAKGIYYFNY